MTFHTIVHVDTRRVIGAVDHRLYGANLEQIGESIYGGIWSEMLKSPKFSGPDRHFVSVAYGGDRNPDAGVVYPWTAVNPDYQRVICDHDCTDFYVRPRYQMDHAVHKGIHPPAGLRGVWTAQQSQRITIRSADGRPHGIAQSQLSVHAGRAYDLRLVLKGQDQPVTVKLGDQLWIIEAAPPDWQTFTTRLTTQKTTRKGRLEITIMDGTLWIARASLMPADHIHGFRADVIGGIKSNWTPTWLRWPGGNFASAYHWQDGIGDRDRRPPYLDPAWQTWEYHDVGTDEFVTFCRLIDCEPVLTVNMGTGGPAEAAAWVDYCNGAATSPFGKMRAANGHPEPHNIKTWFVGNEQFGNWQDGHVDAETYARRFLEFSEAMLAVDPALTLLAVGVPTDQYSHWNARVLDAAGSKIDMLSMHWYSIRTMNWDQPPAVQDLVLAQLAASHEIDFILEKTCAIIAEHSDPAVPLAFDEWNTYIRAKPPHFIEDYNLADGLYTGGVMNACLRRADRIKMSAPFNFTNVMGNYRITPETIWAVPATLVLALMTRFRGTQSVHCRAVDSPTFISPEIGQQLAYSDIPVIDAAATFRPETNELFLSLVNFDTRRRAQIALEGVFVKDGGKVFAVTGRSGTVTNTASEPNAVQITEVDWNGGVLEMPPLSFFMVCLELSRK